MAFRTTTFNIQGAGIKRFPWHQNQNSNHQFINPPSFELFTLLLYKTMGSSLAEDEERGLWPQGLLGQILALSLPAVTLERVM